jgi:hypothetical protein
MYLVMHCKVFFKNSFQLKMHQDYVFSYKFLLHQQSKLLKNTWKINLMFFHEKSLKSKSNLKKQKPSMRKKGMERLRWAFFLFLLAKTLIIIIIIIIIIIKKKKNNQSPWQNPRHQICQK